MATFDFGQPSSTASLIGTGTPKRLFNFGPSSSSLPRSLRQPPGNTNKVLFFQKSSMNLQLIFLLLFFFSNRPFIDLFLNLYETFMCIVLIEQTKKFKHLLCTIYIFI